MHTYLIGKISVLLLNAVHMVCRACLHGEINTQSLTLTLGIMHYVHLYRYTMNQVTYVVVMFICTHNCMYTASVLLKY